MAGTYTQSRDVPPVGELGSWKRVATQGYTIQGNNTPIQFMGRQDTSSFRTGIGETLVSEGELSDRNTYLNNLLQTKEVTYDNGHPFSTVKREAFCRFPSAVQPANYYGVYTTPFVCDEQFSVNYSTFPTIPLWTSQNSDGNKAILKTYPTAPKASLSTAIIELKNEGLPSPLIAQIASFKGGAAKSLGSDFLNYQFGWLPLLSDLEKLLKSVVRSSQIIQQFERDSGRVVRRSYSFPVSTELVGETVYNSAAKALPDSGSPFYGAMGELSITHTRTTKIWFKGAYTYHIDPGKNLVGLAIKYEQLANHLLGTRLTPDVLWNLAPWSWLADWAVNIGNNITVASAFQQDGLVLKYGYLMRQVTAQKLYSFSPVRGVSYGAAKPLPSQLVLRTTSKERVKSTPFGFGLNTADFSGRQWAILGSLGMTKAPRALR